jgi:hypothetical protein
VREVLAQAIKERWRSDLKPTDISALIENSSTRFQQFCIRLSTDNDLDKISKKVANKKLGLPVREKTFRGEHS